MAIKMEKGVSLIFPVKYIQLAALLRNFQGSNKAKRSAKQLRSEVINALAAFFVISSEQS